MYGLTRGFLTLVSLTVAGSLLWAAGGLDAATTGGYWTAEALFIVCGVVLVLGQLVGRSIRAGRPRFSPAVFIVGFLPVLVVGGWLAAAGAPHQGWLERHSRVWAGDIGVLGGVDRLAHYAPLGALVIGLVLGFSFEGAARNRPDQSLASPPADTTLGSPGSAAAAEQRPPSQEDETPIAA